jgi:translation initiation factor IF-3
VVEDLGDTAVVEAQPKQDGRNMVMVIGPTKKAPELRTEASRPGPRSEAPSLEPAPDAETAGESSAPDAVEDSPGTQEQPQGPGSVEGPQPATR